MTLLVSLLQVGHDLSLRLVLSTNDGDTSPCSEPTLLVTEPGGAGTRPGPPQELRVIGCTSSQVRLGWLAPVGGLKPKAYKLHKGKTLLDTTSELR